MKIGYKEVGHKQEVKKRKYFVSYCYESDLGKGYDIEVLEFDRKIDSKEDVLELIERVKIANKLYTGISIYNNVVILNFKEI